MNEWFGRHQFIAGVSALVLAVGCSFGGVWLGKKIAGTNGGYVGFVAGLVLFGIVVSFPAKSTSD